MACLGHLRKIFGFFGCHAGFLNDERYMTEGMCLTGVICGNLHRGALPPLISSFSCLERVSQWRLDVNKSIVITSKLGCTRSRITSPWWYSYVDAGRVARLLLFCVVAGAVEWAEIQERHICANGCRQTPRELKSCFQTRAPKILRKFLYSGLFSRFHYISLSPLGSCSPGTLFLPSAMGGGEHRSSFDNRSGASCSGGLVLGTLLTQLIYSHTSDSHKISFHQPHVPVRGFTNNIWLWPLLLCL